VISRGRWAALALVAMLASSAAPADDAASSVYDAMGIKAGKVMNSSVVSSRVLPADDKETVAVVTYLTGRKEEASALNVRFEIYKTEAGKLVSIFTRDVGKENGGYVGRGEIALLDLDGDGVNEIGLYYDNLKNPLVTERRLEIIVHDDSGFRVAWSGPVEYDATKAVRDVSQDRRDRYLRKLDFANTRRTKGVTLFMTKTVIAVAGERLPQPKQVQETFPLRPAPPQ
jgi:hypothetical protein